MRSRRPRLDSELYIGLRRYVLTFCTHERRQYFTEPSVVHATLDAILRTCPLFDMEMIAYCFMPDHAHFLVEGCSDGASLTSFVHQAKQRSGFVFSQTRKKRLWQPSYYDHVLRDEEATLSVARYIFENPVRARLAAAPFDYPFLGSAKFTIYQILEAVRWQP